MTDEIEAEAKAAFEKLGHKLRELDYGSHGGCCGGSTLLLRCDTCNWWFVYDWMYTREIQADETKVKSLICPGHIQPAARP